MASQSTIAPDTKSKRLRMDKFIPRRSSTLSSSVGPAPPASTGSSDRTPVKSERTRMDKIMRRPSTSSILTSSPPSKSLPESTLPKAAGSRIPRRTSSISIRAATNVPEPDGAKPERSRVDKLLRRSSSSSLAGVTATSIPEPTGAKSERSRMDKILRRSPSSSSSLAISASPESQDAAPSKPESNRKRIASLIRRADASSSDSISMAPTEAGTEDGSPKPKRMRPGAVLRTLSAFSVKQRHGSSSSESLAVDTHAPTPPAEPSAEHQMLSPVAESPTVEQGHSGFNSLPISTETVPPSISQVAAPVLSISAADVTSAGASDTDVPTVAPKVQAEVMEESPSATEAVVPVPTAQLDLPPGLTAEPSSYDGQQAVTAPDVVDADATVVVAAPDAAKADGSADATEFISHDTTAAHDDTAVTGSLDTADVEVSMPAEAALVFDSQDNAPIARDDAATAPDVSGGDTEKSVVPATDMLVVVEQPITLDDTSQSHGEASSTMGFEQFGWLMHQTPGELTPYFTLRGHDVVTDVDLRRDGAILSIYERLSCLDMPPPAGWELWLLDTVGGFVPAPDHNLVNHNLRVVSSSPKSPKLTAVEREKYWEFVEKHPVHCARIVFSEEIVAGTTDALTYEFVKWPVPPGSAAESDSDVPFNEDESDEFSRSLSSFGADPSPDDMAVVAQNVAKVELRLCRWEQRMRESGRLGEERNDTPAGALVNLSHDAQRQMIPALSRVLGGNVGLSGAWGCSIQ